jgi:hypothetical protein
VTDRRCNATVDGKNRCGFAGTQDELELHALETRHWLCAVCARSLRDDETRCCLQCIARTRTALLTIRDTFTELEAAVEATALHPGDLPGGIALVLLADGNDAAPRPYKPEPFTDRPPTCYPELAGEKLTHPAYVDTRPVPDGTEHYADHWPSDPTPPLVAIDSAVRAWRLLFGHPIPDDLPTVDADIDYLLTHLARASRTDEDFPDFAAEVRDLASKLEHVTGQANDPVYAPADCFDCGGALVRDYRPPVGATVEADPRKGLAVEGLPDEWTCRRCERTYEPAEYWLAVRAALEAQAVAS